MNLSLFPFCLNKLKFREINFSRPLNSWLQSQGWNSYLGNSGVQAPSAALVTSDIGVLRWSPRQRDHCRTSESQAPSCAQGSQLPFPGCQGLTLLCPIADFFPETVALTQLGAVQPQLPDLVGETSEGDNGFQNVI